MSDTAERHVIGAVIHDFTKMEECRQLKPEMFIDKKRRRIFTDLLQIYDTGKAFSDSILEAKYQAEPEMMQEVIDSMVSGRDVVLLKPDVEVIVGIYRANMLHKTVYKDLKIDPTQSTEQIAMVINQLEALLEDAQVVETESVADMAAKYHDHYFKEHESITLGFKELDNCTGKLDRGDVTIIGARPSVGKSALALQICKNLVANNYKVGLYNLEMKNQQIYERLISAESGIGLQRIRKATAPLNDEAANFEKANKSLSKYRNLYVTSGAKSVGDIRREIRHMGYDILVIDYLQLVRAADRYKGNREAEVSQVSRELKALAMEMNIHIIALSQLNRQVKPGVEPTMAELRESGSIEQDASCIIMLWLMSDEKHRGWKVDKCRNGTLGEGAFQFDGAHMTFIEEDGFKDVKKEDKTPFDDDPFKQ